MMSVDRIPESAATRPVARRHAPDASVTRIARSRAERRTSATVKLEAQSRESDDQRHHPWR